MAKIASVNESWGLANGTCLQGYVAVDYTQLVALLGESYESDGYKSDAEWVVEFDNGVVATIYNWKNGKNYCGPSGLPVESIRDWHVGGRSTEAVRLVEELIHGR